MHAARVLSDHNHPLVQATASQLTSLLPNQIDKLEAFFHFVRDEIPFGFTPKWDDVSASETLEYQVGYCNTKAALFHVLCKTADIPSRIHSGLIDIYIMKGVFPAFAFPFLPKSGGHSWSEVNIDGLWKPIDSYINDKPFYENAIKLLHESGQVTAFSVS